LIRGNALRGILTELYVAELLLATYTVEVSKVNLLKACPVVLEKYGYRSGYAFTYVECSKSPVFLSIVVVVVFNQ
jgi:hypothetical protein